MESKEVKEEQKEAYNLVKVPTGETLAIQDEEGNILSFEYAIVYLLNELKKIKKLIG